MENPFAPTLSYEIAYKYTQNALSDYTVAETVSSSTYGLHLRNLEEGDITVRVRASTAFGWGEPGYTTAKAVWATSSVNSLRAYPDSDVGSLRVAWSVPSFLRGQTISDYVITYTTASESVVVSQPAVNGTEILLTGLKQGWPYRVQVQAKTTVGLGTASFVDVYTKLYVPSRVVELMVEKSSQSTFDLTWKAPLSAVTPVTKYVITYYHSGLAVSVDVNATAEKSWRGIECAEVDYGRFIMVEAVNTYGIGPDSAANPYSVCESPE